MDGKKKLLMKRKERDNKQLLKAFSESEKTLAEVIEFLQLKAFSESEKTLAEVIEFLQGNKSSED